MPDGNTLEIRSSEPYNSSEKLALEKIFPKNNDGLFNIGIIAIHGNEPYIIAASIAMKINEILKANGLMPVRIVLPSLYGNRTKQILSEEFPNQEDMIFISDDLGKILKQTEFSKAGYQAHLESVVEKQPETQENLLNFLSRPFNAISLNGEGKEFLPHNRRLEINAGANVSASDKGEKKTHFIFPVLLSELMEATNRKPVLKAHFNQEVLQKVQRYAQDMEETYRTAQVPYISTLSAEPWYQPTKGKTLTPALKSKRISPQIFIKNGSGIYVMASGNEIGKEVLEHQAKKFSSKGYDIISPAWLKLDFGQQAIPDVIFNPDVKVVMGRSGWGILWMAQVAEKPFIALPPLWFDNPEILLNNGAITEYGLGVEFNAKEGLVEAVQAGKTSSENIRKLNEKIYRELGIPQGKDAIAVAAENILRSEINSKTAETKL